MALDRGHRHAEIGCRLALAPCGEMGEEAAIDLRGKSASVGSDFLEHDGVERASIAVEIGEEFLETQERHARAFEAAGTEFGDARGNPARTRQHGPSGSGSKIKREDRSRRRRRHCGRRRDGRAFKGEGKHGFLLS